VPRSSIVNSLVDPPFRGKNLSIKRKKCTGVAAEGEVLMSDVNAPDHSTSMPTQHWFFELVVVLWLIAVNCFYYMQYKSLILARLAVLQHQ
jgi:hypothetical protein